MPTGFAELDEVTNGLHPGQMIVVAARPGVGKALALDTPLPTPTGWTTMGEVAVGDELIGADGKPTRVVAVTDVMHRAAVLSRSSSPTAQSSSPTNQHQWLTETRASRKSAQAAAVQYNRYKNQRTFAAVRTTREIAETLRCATVDRRLNHSVVNAKPLQAGVAELPVPPYTLGAWLGDGTSASAQITIRRPRDRRCGSRPKACRPTLSVGSIATRLLLPEAPPPAARACVVCGSDFRPADQPSSDVRPIVRRARRFMSEPVPAPSCAECGARTCGSGCARSAATLRTLQARLRTIGVLGNKHIPVELSARVRRHNGALCSPGCSTPTARSPLAAPFNSR